MLLNWTWTFECTVTSGPFLVSRTGDAGWTEREVKVPECTLIRHHYLLINYLWCLCPNFTMNWDQSASKLNRQGSRSIGKNCFLSVHPQPCTAAHRSSENRQPTLLEIWSASICRKLEIRAKSVDSSRQPDGGHGSRKPLRSVDT